MRQIHSATDAGPPPEMGPIRTRANQIAFWSWCAMLFCIPFSTALGLLVSATAVVSGLVGFSVQSFKTAIRQPAIGLCVLLFVWLTISMLWSIAPRAEMLEAWSKYRKLLYPALALMVLYNLKKSPRAMIFSFLGGTGLVALVSLASAYGLLQILLGPPEVAGCWYVGPGWLFIGGPENPTFGRNHITQSAFLVVASTLAFGQAWQQCVRNPASHFIQKFLWSVAGFLYIQPVFLLQSRTGYVLALTAVIFWIVMCIRHMNIKQAIPVILVGASMLISMAANSPHILHRIKAMSESVAGYVGHGEMIDSGVRLEFWRAGITIFAESPIIGRGLGSYAEAYSALEGRPKWLVENRSQPHSEFVLQAVQGGGVALLIFCWIIFNIINTGFRNSYADPAILGATALYFIDASFNSVIWDLAEGHILIVFVCASVFQKMRSKVHRNF